MTAIKVIGADGVGWSIDKDREHAKTLIRAGGHGITESFLKAEVWLVIWYDLLSGPRYYCLRWLKRLMRKRLYATITNDVTFTPEKLARLAPHVDLFISPNRKIERFVRSKGIQTVRIPFYCDENVFRPSARSQKSLCKELGIEHSLVKGKRLIGSFQRDSEGNDLEKPKWQKDPGILIDIARRIENSMLLLAGPRRHYIAKECRRKKVPFVFVGDPSYHATMQDDLLANNLDDEQIALLYNLADIYIVSSKSESGPKAVLEAALTRTPIISTRVGLAPDFLHEDLIYEGADDAARIALAILGNARKRERYVSYNRRSVLRGASAKAIARKYAELFG